MSKTIYFYYKRDSIPHSEYQLVKALNRFLDNKEIVEYKISTSTASIFNIVRAFCYQHKLNLVAYYEDLELKLDENMRMEDWSNCSDFEIEEKALDILFLTTEDERKNFNLIL